jgi:glycosyltransferase involved in cell wall biosynthesis
MSDNPHTIKLSICIATFNRARFIGELLESIASQCSNDSEVVISDNASTDNTMEVVSSFTGRLGRLRYSRQDTNVGIDRNFDRAVTLASGQYCWLMSDDDLLRPGAISMVLVALRQDPSLVIVNYERRNFDMSKLVLSRYLDVSADHVYEPEEIDRLFVETADLLIYIGCIVIKREIWLKRDRQKYYGSMLMYIGVIFQERLPGPTALISSPLVSYRDGNIRTFWPEMFEIFMITWPALVRSLAPSDSAKKKVVSDKPWKNPLHLLWYRAMGFYSMTEYWRWIYPQRNSIWDAWVPALVAVLPGILVNTLLVTCCSVTRSRLRDLNLLWLTKSRFYLGNYRLFTRDS